MENILEQFFDAPSFHGENSAIAKIAEKKIEKMTELEEGMTEKQKQLLDDYFDLDTEITTIIEFNRFRYAFSLGAQIMAEIIEGQNQFFE